MSAEVPTTLYFSNLDTYSKLAIQSQTGKYISFNSSSQDTKAAEESIFLAEYIRRRLIPGDLWFINSHSCLYRTELCDPVNLGYKIIFCFPLCWQSAGHNRLSIPFCLIKPLCMNAYHICLTVLLFQHSTNVFLYLNVHISRHSPRI